MEQEVQRHEPCGTELRAGAAELWRGEVGKLYETLKQSADTAATEVLDTDREALFAYADAVQALYGDEAAANLLRLRCAQLCCMLNTAPNDLRLGLLGQWTAAILLFADSWATF